MRWKAGAVSVCVLGSAFGGLAQAAPIDVWVMAGQSNMVGGLGLEELPTDPIDFTQPQDDVGYWWWIPSHDLEHSDGWEYLRPFAPLSGSSYSAELTFGRRLADADTSRRVAIVKVAQNGTNLFRDWNPSATTGRFLYQRLMDEVNTATESLSLATPDDEVNIAGVVWVQGTADARDVDTATAYQQNLTDLIHALRQDLEVPDLPFMFNQLHAESDPEYRDVLRQSQAAVGAADPLAFMVNADDLGLRDEVHLDGTGRLALGDRFARIAIRLSMAHGDMNGDGVVDAFDVSPFELALADRQSYLGAYPTLSADVLGDMNGDGLMDAFDVSGFESVLATESTVPEPASLMLMMSGLMLAARRPQPSSNSIPTSRANSTADS